MARPSRRRTTGAGARVWLHGAPRCDGADPAFIGGETAARLVRRLQRAGAMRILSSTVLLLVGTATLAGAQVITPYTMPSAPPPPPATAKELGRAQRLATEAQQRLQTPPHTGGGWARPEPRRR